MLGSQRHLRVCSIRSTYERYGWYIRFVWEENDEKLWEEFVKLLPEETTDNWKAKQNLVIYNLF